MYIFPALLYTKEEKKKTGPPMEMENSTHTDVSHIRWPTLKSYLQADLLFCSSDSVSEEPALGSNIDAMLT